MSAPVITDERVRDFRMLIPGLTGWGVCALATWLRPPSWTMVVGLVLATLVILLAHYTNRVGLTATLPVILIATVMLGAVSAGAWSRDQPQLASQAGNRLVGTIELAETLQPGDRSARAVLMAIDGVKLERGPVSLRMVGDVAFQRTSIGSSAEVTGQLQRGENADQQAWVLFVSDAPESWTPPGWLLGSTDQLRAEFLELSLERDNDAGQLLPGLAIGDTSAVDDGLVTAMRETSLSHLVAVSGANCAIIVALVVAVVALFGGGLWVRMVAGVAALLGFVVLVTPEPSITRAAIMASIVLIFLASSRPVRGIPVLGTTVLILLATDPWLSTDFAFALSVLATGGILVLSGPLVRLMSPYVPPALALVLALPLAAQIACQPLLILLNPIIPVWAVVANAVAAPAAPVATILGMLACLAGPVWPGLANVIVWLAWLPAGYIAAIARVLADTPWSVLPWPGGWWGVVAIAVMGYGLAAYVLMKHTRHTVWRRVLGGSAVLALLAVVVGFFLPQWATRASVPSEWTVAQCPVGQGDAVVLRSLNEVVVIDVGEFPELISQCLGMLGVSRISLLVITHFDKDHVGGWTGVIDRTDAVWVGGIDSDQDRAIVEGMVERGASVRQVSSGDGATVGGYDLAVVWPSSPSIQPPGNDSSVVIRATPTEQCEVCLSGLYLGDLGEEAQRILMGREHFAPHDIVKVSHHGSRDQYSVLYDALAAPVALIGVGANNTYGHPTASILEVVEKYGVVIRSDVHGLATLHRSGSGGIVKWSEH